MRGIDFEATNRCNANCHFCPRDATPHQGLMSLETFEQALGYAHRMQEIHTANGRPLEHITLCGLGEPTLHPKLPLMVERIREEGFDAHMASNGSLLDARRTERLLEAGLQEVALNIGEIGEAYEEIYELPWETTLARVKEFIEVAQGRCNIRVVLVDHRGSREHLRMLQAFWRELGVTEFQMPALGNRGGALELPEMDFLNFPELDVADTILTNLPTRPICGVPMQDRFVGYDGYVYLCCQDWKKEAPVGHVSDPDISEIIKRQLEFVLSRDVVCKTCKHEPTNRLTAFLRAAKNGDIDYGEMHDFVLQLGVRTYSAMAAADELAPDIDAIAMIERGPTRRRIPVEVQAG